MASLTRAKAGYFLNTFSNILLKNSLCFQKNTKALFHFSLVLNVKGQEIKMPSLSPTMVEGKIVKWLKKEGDTISPGDVICDIETDKAVMAMEIEEEGILAKIVVPENSSLVKVGSLIAVMVAEGEDWKNVEMPSGEQLAPPESSDSSTSSSSSSSSDSDSEPDTKGSIGGGPPTISVSMPSLSPTMTQGTIVKWLKKEGDTIAPGDVLCDIQTDKAVMSMETEEEGILAKIILPDDSKDVKVGTLIALIVPEGEDWKNVKVPSTEKVKASEDTVKSSAPTGGADIRSKTFGPAVKSLLAAYQLEPGLIKATGRNNRLLKEDVLKFVEDNKLEKKPPKAVSAPAAVTPTKPSVPKPSVSKVKPPTVSSNPYKDIEISNVRQMIAKKLLQSKMEIPHSYSTVKCNMGKLMEAEEMFKENGIKVSVNDLLIKATALALQIYPKANALCINNEVKLSKDIDVCVALSAESGFYTHVVKSTNLKSIVTISEEIRYLADKAKIGELEPNEIRGGTFTISNLGMFGVTHFKGIINPPQCGILAVGDTIESFDGDLVPQKYAILNLSYDRRALEEHEAGKFMEALKYVIENPKLLVFDVEKKFSEMSL